MEFSVKVDLDLVSSFSSDELAAYIALLTHLYSVSHRTHKFPTSVDMLCFYATGTDKYPQSFHSAVNKGLDELQFNGYIHGKQPYVLTIYIPGYDAERLLNPKRFVTLYLWEIQKIICSKYIEKFAVLKYYIFLLSTFNNGVGRMTLDILQEVSGFARMSVISYNNILQKLKIIVIVQNKESKSNYVRNIYARYEDAEIIGGTFDEDGELIDI